MIISDLCDEYAVLVSQNKAPAYGYDNTNVPYGWSSTMTVPWSESDHWGTSAGRSPSISFRCRLVSPVHQGLWRTSSATTSRTCSAATPKGTPSVRRRRSKRVANCIDAYSMASRTVPPPPYALLLEGAAMADRPTTYGGRGMEIIGDDELRPGI